MYSDGVMAPRSAVATFAETAYPQLEYTPLKCDIEVCQDRKERRAAEKCSGTSFSIKCSVASNQLKQALLRKRRLLEHSSILNDV